MHSIRRVLIKNFKCHEELRWIISGGITTIVAPNGGGKSSFAQAMAWCLFGASAAPATQEDLIRTGADECFVSMDLAFSGMANSDYYTFERSYSVRDGTTARVYQNCELIAEKSTGVAEFLAASGIDLEGFQMIYAEQGELSFFVHATPAIRKQIVSSLFQVDSLNDLISDIRESHREILREKDALPDTSEHSEHANLKRFIVHFGIEMEIYEHKIAEMENEYEEVKGKLNAASDAIKFISEIQDINIKVANLSGAITRLKDECRDIEAVSEPAHVSREMIEVSSFAESVAESSLSDSEISFFALVTDFEEIGKKLKEIEKGFCPTCGSEGITLFEYKQGLEESRRKIAGLVDAVKGESLRLSKEFDAITTAHSSLVKQYEVSKAWEEGGWENSLEVKREKIVEYENDIVQEEINLSELPKVDVDEINGLQKSIEIMANDINSVRGQYRKAEYQRDHAKKRVEEDLEELLILDLMTAKEENLGKLKKAMPLFRDVVLAQSLEWVARRASILLTTSTTDFKEVRIDTDLNFWVDNRKLNHYSSGQIDLVCVCIRVAIAEYLSSRIGFSGLLILDGVFDRIDEDNRDAIGRLLSEINLDQVIVLSHFEVPIIGGREIRIK